VLRGCALRDGAPSALTMGPATMGERLNLSEHHSVLSAQLLEKARHAATPGEAHRLIERARIIDPTNPVVLEQSAMVHRREGRFMECIGDLLVARRRAQQSLALDGFSGVPDVLRRAPEAAKMDAQGRPLTAATSASGATATPPGSALADGNLGDRSKHEVKQWMGILRGGKRVRNARLLRLLSRSISTRFG